jgi:hypothetical protein
LKGGDSTGCRDIEAQSLNHEVFLKNKRYSEAYTLALRNPARFEKERTPNFLINRAQFDVGRNSGQGSRSLRSTYTLVGQYGMPSGMGERRGRRRRGCGCGVTPVFGPVAMVVCMGY